MTVDALIRYFYDIIGGTALPPMQVGVWTPKAKAGPEADHFRPLGMPNTIDRLVDGSIAAYVMHHTAHLMHPSQAVMRTLRNPRRLYPVFNRFLTETNLPVYCLLIFLRPLKGLTHIGF